MLPTKVWLLRVILWTTAKLIKVRTSSIISPTLSSLECFKKCGVIFLRSLPWLPLYLLFIKFIQYDNAIYGRRLDLLLFVSPPFSILVNDVYVFF